jgi:pimeloyl-ACP methyl ester carboxylesterase
MIYPHLDRSGLRRTVGYDVQGEGAPTLLLLHPFPFARGFWDNIRDHLADHRTIAIDGRGFGESELGEPGFSIDELADDAIALLDHLGVPMVVAVGCSMGGYVAMSLAARHPARLAGLVLCDTRAGADGPEARANRDAAAMQIKQNGPQSYLTDLSRRLCSVSSSDEVRAQVQALAERSAPDAARALPATLRALRDRPDRTQLLGKLRVPTLVVVGTDDAVTPPDEADAMARAIPGAERAEITGAGHLPSVERPDAFLAELHGFLANL